MPRYAYRCKQCDHSFEIVHSMSEKKKDCPSCSANESLVRVPNLVTRKIAQKTKAGDVVKEFIKDAKQEVREEKERMQKEEYKP